MVKVQKSYSLTNRAHKRQFWRIGWLSVILNSRYGAGVSQVNSSFSNTAFSAPYFSWIIYFKTRSGGLSHYFNMRLQLYLFWIPI